MEGNNVKLLKQLNKTEAPGEVKHLGEFVVTFDKHNNYVYFARRYIEFTGTGWKYFDNYFHALAFALKMSKALKKTLRNDVNGWRN